MSQIRFRNTRTGKVTAARDMRDAAHMVKIESDRRTGAELAAQGCSVCSGLMVGVIPVNGGGRICAGCGRTI